MPAAAAAPSRSPAPPGMKNKRKKNGLCPPDPQSGRGKVSQAAEEDPGEGKVCVRLSGSNHEVHLDKRSFARRSAYFRHWWSFNKDKSEEEREERVLQLHPEQVSAEALLVIAAFVNNSILIYTTEELQLEQAEEILVAANFLQIDVVQDSVLELIKKMVSKENFVIFYNKYCAAGLRKLQTFIMSTIVLPAEAARRRKYGPPDLVIKLQQFPFKCHKAVMVSVSKKVRRILDANSSIKIIEGKDLGFTDENAQLAYNMLERIYLNEESFGSESMSDSLEVLKLITILELKDNFYQSHVGSLCRWVSVSNVAEIYHAGVEMGHEEVVSIALQFLTFKIRDPSLQPFFLKLPLQHVCKVLSSSRLDVPDGRAAGQLALKWLETEEKTLAEREELLQQVRGSQLSPLEAETFLSSPSQPHIEPLLFPGEAKCEGRGWPQQLAVVSSYKARLSIHWYDLQRKSWSVLASKDLPGWRRRIGVTQISDNRLVFTQLNPENPWKPFTVSVYDIWSDTWSIPAEELSPVKRERRKQAQSVVTLKDEIFSVLSEGQHGKPILCGASRLTSPSPIFTMYGPLPGPPRAEDTWMTSLKLVLTGTKVNVVHGQTVSSYDTTSHRWEQSRVGGKGLVASSWLPLSDGRVLRAGGIKNGEASTQCSVFTGGLGGQPVSLGDLSHPRHGHFLAQLRGHVFAAGGNRSAQGSSKKRQVVRSFVEYYVPGTDIWHPLPVQPPLSHSASVLGLLVVNTPIRCLQNQQRNNNLTMK